MNITVDGYNINYKITGEGLETIVILQGWGTHLGVYDWVADSVNSKYRVLQFDLPGFGGSDEPKTSWNVDEFADFFCKLMQALDIRKATLIGHSYGGRIIIKLATRDNIPFEIDRVVLIDSAGIMPKRSLWKKIKTRKYKILNRIFKNKVIYALFPELIDDWRSRQGSSDYRNASPVMRNCLVKAVNEDLTDLLPRIKQDTLLVWGDKDTATPISDAQIMKDKIPSSGLVVLEGTGHFSFLEKPNQFRAIMQSYFEIGVVR